MSPRRSPPQRPRHPRTHRPRSRPTPQQQPRLPRHPTPRRRPRLLRRRRSRSLRRTPIPHPTTAERDTYFVLPTTYDSLRQQGYPSTTVPPTTVPPPPPKYVLRTTYYVLHPRPAELFLDHGAAGDATRAVIRTSYYLLRTTPAPAGPTPRGRCSRAGRSEQPRDSLIEPGNPRGSQYRR